MAEAMVNYASYTYAHPNFLVRFPHLRRMKMLNAAINKRPVGRWLDYGTGDAEVYRNHAATHAPVEAVLYEPQTIIEQARAKAPNTARPSIWDSGAAKAVPPNIKPRTTAKIFMRPTLKKSTARRGAGRCGKGPKPPSLPPCRHFRPGRSWES